MGEAVGLDGDGAGEGDAEGDAVAGTAGDGAPVRDGDAELAARVRGRSPAGSFVDPLAGGSDCARAIMNSEPMTDRTRAAAMTDWVRRPEPSAGWSPHVLVSMTGVESPVEGR